MTRLVPTRPRLAPLRRALTALPHGLPTALVLAGSLALVAVSPALVARARPPVPAGAPAPATSPSSGDALAPSAREIGPVVLVRARPAGPFPEADAVRRGGGVADAVLGAGHARIPAATPTRSPAGSRRGVAGPGGAAPTERPTRPTHAASPLPAPTAITAGPGSEPTPTPRGRDVPAAPVPAPPRVGPPGAPAPSTAPAPGVTAPPPTPRPSPPAPAPTPRPSPPPDDDVPAAKT